MTGPRHLAMLAGEPVKPGQAITDFRGEAWIFAYVTTGPVSFGKIVARDAEAKMQREFFPHVFPGLSVEPVPPVKRSEEHTSELQSLMRISYAVFCLKKKNKTKNNNI